MNEYFGNYNQINTYQFITFRTKDSIDSFVQKLNIEDTNESIKQHKIDDYLDQSDNGCYLNNEIIDLIIQYSLQLDPEYYQLFCLSVIPNHVHILFQQKQELNKIMQKLKGGLAFSINKRLNNSGTLWQRGYFDKAMRDEKHFQTTYNYIKNNAIKANLADATERFYGVYE